MPGTDARWSLAKRCEICFKPGTAYNTVFSSDLDGSPSGSPNYMIAADNKTHKDLAEWKFHAAFAKPEYCSRYATLSAV